MPPAASDCGLLFSGCFTNGYTVSRYAGLLYLQLRSESASELCQQRLSQAPAFSNALLAPAGEARHVFIFERDLDSFGYNITLERMSPPQSGVSTPDQLLTIDTTFGLSCQYRFASTYEVPGICRNQRSSSSPSPVVGMAVAVGIVAFLLCTALALLARRWHHASTGRRQLDHLAPRTPPHIIAQASCQGCLQGAEVSSQGHVRRASIYYLLRFQVSELPNLILLLSVFAQSSR